MTAPLHPVVLIVDDEQGILDAVGEFAAEADFEVVTARGGREAIAVLQRRPADLALVDLRMPDINGLEVLREIKTMLPSCEVVLMTGYASVDSAIEAIKLGARDYLSKPFDFARLRQLLASVREDAHRRQNVTRSERLAARHLEFAGMLGRAPAMQEIFSLIRRLAPHARTALVTGETGTGKELVARAFHGTGPRRAKRFVTINCSAMVETLFESELFGHVRGAFTGATEAKPGLFEAADGGTIFLDEIGELPLAVQAKLLRVLELGEVQRVGALDTRRVDVSVVAATNRDLHAEIAAGRFRSDLFYRLDVVHIHVPPLRDRREDIPYLTAAFVDDCAKRLRKRLVGLSPAAESILLTAPWQGNVRELRNVIERACMLAETHLITERELAGRLSGAEDPAPPAPRVPPATELTAAPTSDSLSQLECDHILRILQQTGGNKKAAAKVLGVSRRALYRRLERHGHAAVIRRRNTAASH